MMRNTYHVRMTPCHVVHITTPKKYLLNGLWFGPTKPTRVIVWVHGLGSSAFSKVRLAQALAGRGTAVLSFNNRGHDVVANLPNVVKQDEKRRKRLLAGAAHERFMDSEDDIQGAINFARKTGARRIFLAGHSTGCQKSIYWAYKKKSRGVKGILLFAPVNDYAGALARHGKQKLARAERVARALVAKGKPHELLPSDVWSEEPDDAQRWLSLYTPDSVENIFCYDDEKKVPRILRAVRVPILVLWAGEDEYADRPAELVAAWFERHLNNRDTCVIIPSVTHGFKGSEKRVAREVGRFVGAL